MLLVVVSTSIFFAVVSAGAAWAVDLGLWMMFLSYSAGGSVGLICVALALNATFAKPRWPHGVTITTAAQ